MANCDFPIVLKEILPERDFLNLDAFLIDEGWQFKNTDASLISNSSWTIPDLTNLTYYEVASLVIPKVKKWLKCNLSVVKIHVNGQTLGQVSSFHRDSDLDNVWTLVIFTNVGWDMNDGGEFTLFNPVTNEYVSVSYLPNTGVLFPSNWEHRGACPLSTKAGVRTSLAISFCLTEQLSTFLESRKKLRQFVY